MSDATSPTDPDVNTQVDRMCQVCGERIGQTREGPWVHRDPAHDPWAAPIHAPQPMEPLDSCVCGEHFYCPDGWHSNDQMPCSCTADCTRGKCIECDAPMSEDGECTNDACGGWVFREVATID